VIKSYHHFFSANPLLDKFHSHPSTASATLHQTEPMKREEGVTNKEGGGAAEKLSWVGGQKVRLIKIIKVNVRM